MKGKIKRMRKKNNEKEEITYSFKKIKNKRNGLNKI